MKNIFLFPALALTLFCWSNLKAQDLQTTNETTHVSGVSGTSAASQLKAYVDVVNASSNVIEVECAREILVQEASAATEQFCFADFCFAVNTAVSPLTVTMNPGDVASATVENSEGVEVQGPGFTGYYNYNGEDGICQIEYCFREVGNESNQTCITVHYCVGPNGACDTFLGTNEIIEETVLGQVSPNPASSNFLVSYKLGSEAVDTQLIIMNALGEEVRNVPLSARTGVVNFDASDLQTGMYFYTIKNNGKTEGTKKFIVSH